MALKVDVLIDAAGLVPCKKRSKFFWWVFSLSGRNSSMFDSGRFLEGPLCLREIWILYISTRHLLRSLYSCGVSSIWIVPTASLLKVLVRTPRLHYPVPLQNFHLLTDRSPELVQMLWSWSFNLRHRFLFLKDWL